MFELGFLQMDHGVHLPFAGRGAEATSFIVTAMVHPELSDAASSQFPNEWHRLRPRLLITHAPGEQAHDGVKNDEINPADTVDNTKNGALALGAVEGPVLIQVLAHKA